MKCRACDKNSYGFLMINPCNCSGRVHEQCLIGSVCIQCHQEYRLPAKGYTTSVLYVLSTLFALLSPMYSAVGVLWQVLVLCSCSLCYTLCTLAMYNLHARLYSVVMVGWILAYICGVAIWSIPTWYALVQTYIMVVLLSIMFYLDYNPKIDNMPSV